MSNSLTIITNHVPRPVLDASELTETERAEFDYLNWPALERGEDSASFFRYKGETYHLNEFTSTGYVTLEDRRVRLPETSRAVDEISKDWDAFQSDTFFSGIVIKWADDAETVIVGRYMS